MRLRSTVERVLPLKEGEKRLSKSTRGSVFHGVYATTKGIKEVKEGRKPWGLPAVYGMDAVVSDAPDRTLRISRAKRNGDDKFTVFKMPNLNTYSGAARMVINGIGHEYEKLGIAWSVQNEMRDPAALARASRVESVAAKLKWATTALTAVAATVAIAVERPNIDVERVNFLANAPTIAHPLDTNHTLPPSIDFMAE